MIFVDTGAFLGRFIERDQYHEVAQLHWKKLAREGRRVLTSNFVLDETLTLLARRTSYTFAAERAESLFESNVIEILRPDQDDERAALVYFRKFADQEVSFTDCVSFVLMRRYRIPSAFTFDRHFVFAGFTVEPQ